MVQEAIYFNNKLIILPLDGGAWSWSEASGWAEISDSDICPSMGNCEIEILNGKLWILSATATLTDLTASMHYSTDGTSWTEINGNLPYDGVSGYYTAVLNGRLYVIGGTIGNNYNPDVWAYIPYSEYTP